MIAECRMEEIFEGVFIHMPASGTVADLWKYQTENFKFLRAPSNLYTPRRYKVLRLNTLNRQASTYGAGRTNPESSFF